MHLPVYLPVSISLDHGHALISAAQTQVMAGKIYRASSWFTVMTHKQSGLISGRSGKESQHKIQPGI